MDGTIALMLVEAFLVLLGLSICKAVRFIFPSLYSNQPVAVHNSRNDDEILSQTVPPPPGTQTVPPPPGTEYDVFLSFRGEDTRHTFASYLYKAFVSAGIHTFMDHKLHKGEQISPVLLRTIEESQVSVIIFSENYATSSWCMDELVHILECKKKFGRVVIPIFYNVDPSNIRKQNGSFGKGFDVLKQRFKGNRYKCQKWTNALIQSSSLSGWDSKSSSNEFKLIEEIVKDTLSKLKYGSSSRLKGLIHIAGHIKTIEEVVTQVRIVEICGQGGTGKTTLARAVFERLKPEFEAFTFVGNVRAQLERIGLEELLEKFLQQLYKDEDLKDDHIKTYHYLRSTFLTNGLRHKKILLVLDDVDNSRASDDLIKACDWFGAGSRIIITSRDTHLGLGNSYATYDVLNGLTEMTHGGFVRYFARNGRTFTSNGFFTNWVK